MMVTAIEETRRKGRFNIYLEGEYAGTISDEALVLAKLQPGSEIEPARLTALIWQSDLKKAREKALDLLSRRAYSRGEVMERLTKVYPEELAAEVCSQLSEVGLIDDQAYAEKLAEELSTMRGYGPYRVQFELKKRGVDEEIIRQVLGDVKEGQQQNIDQVLHTKYARYLEDPEDRKNRNKVTQALARMGYSYPVIREALSRYFADMEEIDGE